MLRSTDRPAMTIAVDLGRKATKQTNKTFIGTCIQSCSLSYSQELRRLHILLPGHFICTQEKDSIKTYFHIIPIVIDKLRDLTEHLPIDVIAL